MNRVLKFRAWDKIASMFCQVSWCVGIDNSGTLYPVQTKPNTDIVLMQFTGLVDSKGVEIYEGDIVKYGEWNGEIKFNKGEFYCKFYGGGIPSNGMAWHWTVIGNIYENKELLASPE